MKEGTQMFEFRNKIIEKEVATYDRLMELARKFIRLDEENRRVRIWDKKVPHHSAPPLAHTQGHYSKAPVSQSSWNQGQNNKRDRSYGDSSLRNREESSQSFILFNTPYSDILYWIQRNNYPITYPKPMREVKEAVGDQ